MSRNVINFRKFTKQLIVETFYVLEFLNLHPESCFGSSVRLCELKLFLQPGLSIN